MKNLQFNAKFDIIVLNIFPIVDIKWNTLNYIKNKIEMKNKFLDIQYIPVFYLLMLITFYAIFKWN